MRLTLLVGAALFTAGAVSVRAGDDFRFYNIIPYSPGREEVAAADAAEYAERTGNEIVLYSLTLHPEGVPASRKVDEALASYRKFAKHLEGTSAKPGVLLQSILGHWPRTDKEIEPWQRTVDISGACVRFCPLDAHFAAYIRETAAKIARVNPCVLMSDDDVRAFSPQAECFCPLHTAIFNQRTGRNVTPDEFRRLIAGARLGSPEHTVFVELQNELVATVCRLLREGLDSVEPNIPAGVCMPGWAWEEARAQESSRLMAGRNEPFLRLANGRYTEGCVKNDFASDLFRTFTKAGMCNAVPWLLDESDTWPHNQWSKSAVAFHAKLAVGAFLGLRGAKVWYVNAHKNHEPVSRRYTEILAEHRGYYDAIARAVEGTRLTGFRIPCHREFPVEPVAAGARTTPPFDLPNWGTKIFGVFGVPFSTTFDLDEDAAYALAGGNAVARFSDAQIRQMLKHRLLVDGYAAEALIKRGFSSEIGVVSEKGHPTYTSEREETTGRDVVFPMSCKAPIFKALPGARILSSLVWRAYGGAVEFSRVAPSAVLFDNQVGGRVLVTAYHLGMGGPYSHSEARQSWFLRMFGALSDGPQDNICVNSQNLQVLTRVGKDGDLVWLINLNADPTIDLRLTRKTQPAKVEMLTATGQWNSVVAAWRDGILTLPISLPHQGEVLLRLSSAE